LNNSLGFPGIFRGVLDARARTVSDEMAMAAAHELAQFAEERGLRAESLLPRMDDGEVFPRIAVATAMQAQTQGLARLSRDRQALYADARAIMNRARLATQVLMREQLIPAMPAAGES
jgi:malate dehydrogenase (oxaloacetate-decarboxylating)